MEKIKNFLLDFLRQRKFVFRFDIYTGEEGEPGEVYVEDVVEYEFVNQGTTIVELNSGLFIYPFYSGIQPWRVKLAVNYNERDETIYKYNFLPLDYRMVYETDTKIGTAVVFTPIIVKATDPRGTVKVPTFNQLLVISKLRYRPTTMSEENPGKRKPAKK